MRIPKPKVVIRLALAGCVIATSIYLSWVYFTLPRGPYARLERMGKNALRLSTGNSPNLIDRFTGLIHGCEPRIYYADEAGKEERKLLASGLLVETKIPILNAQATDDDVFKALEKNYQKTGAYWSARFDPSHRVAYLYSKPEDAAAFVGALTNK